jgi:TM2 domain-containing membrane protein YozV
MKICKKCLNEIEDAHLFCKYCGSAQDVGEITPEANKTPQDVVSKLQDMESKLKAMEAKLQSMDTTPKDDKVKISEVTKEKSTEALNSPKSEDAGANLDIDQNAIVFRSPNINVTESSSSKKHVFLILVCFLFGFLGLHRILTGKIKSGLLMFITVGSLYFFEFFLILKFEFYLNFSKILRSLILTTSGWDVFWNFYFILISRHDWYIYKPYFICGIACAAVFLWYFTDLLLIIFGQFKDKNGFYVLITKRGLIIGVICLTLWSLSILFSNISLSLFLYSF